MTPDEYRNALENAIARTAPYPGYKSRGSDVDDIVLMLCGDASSLGAYGTRFRNDVLGEVTGFTMEECRAMLAAHEKRNSV